MSEEELNQMSKYELIGIIKAQKFEIEQLENIRKEALEYIEGFYYPDERQLTHEFDGWDLAKLYDILNKGDNNE